MSDEAEEWMRTRADDLRHWTVDEQALADWMGCLISDRLYHELTGKEAQTYRL